jgi:hypothetical protein
MSNIQNTIKYPYITDLINNGEGLNKEYLFEMKVTAIAFGGGDFSRLRAATKSRRFRRSSPFFILTLQV